MSEAAGRKTIVYTIGAKGTEKRAFFSRIAEFAIAGDASIEAGLATAMEAAGSAKILHDGDHDHDHGQSTDLSFKVRPGNNIYAFQLEVGGQNDTKARFGAGNAPLVLLPPFTTKAEHPFDDFGLFHLQAGNVVRIPHNQIPDTPTKLPAQCYAAFVANSAKLRAFARKWQGRDDDVIRIPFVFNFWNIDPYFPIWEQLGPPAAGDVKMVTHGGIHPTSQVNYIELAP